jgi:peptide/nickel transport system substrate-binding protein
MLAAPHIAAAQRDRTLRFAPQPELTALDPVWFPNRATHNHGYLVFDTLYGLDETLTARPQMVDGHIVEGDGTLWTIRLRDGLRFHDGTPVLARDAVSSIRRFAARDAFGQSLMAATSELSAPDDRTVRFRLSKPFPHLPASLAGSGLVMPCIMPERLANTDPSRQVTEMVGSGPYRFVAAEYNSGVRASYERNTAYVPRGDGKASFTAGPKVTHFDRVEWQSLGDAATSVAALAKGEIDWLESLFSDQAPVLARNPNVTIEVKETAGSFAIMRFNHLYYPFNNPAIRRAMLGAVDQADVMEAVSGTDRTYWHDRIGLFDPASPLANDAGIEALSSPRDYDKVKRDLKEAGYRGEPIVVLAVSGANFHAPISQVGVDQLRKAGLNLDVQTMDVGTLFRRRMSKAAPDRGGWNVYFTVIDVLFSANPATNAQIRGDPRSGMPGWPDSSRLEALREAWLDAESLDVQKRIGEQMQLQMWRDVPYIPLGHWVRSTAHQRDIIDLPWGFAAFYGVRRA